MTTTTDLDAAWLAEARARVARGGPWERSRAEVERAAHAVRDARRAAAPAPLSCPFWDHHPPLETLRRYELVTNTPLRYCPNCYGFWAAGDSLAGGVADPYDDHPALRAGPPPRRCRACHGHLKPNGDCTKCKRPLPPATCPSCRKPMARFERKGITVDGCDTCHGIWFDMGEITAVFEIPAPQGLAASTVDEHATDDEPPSWLVALDILARLFIPFI
jgi:Zn-finger nucleic acid-binding protein